MSSERLPFTLSGNLSGGVFEIPGNISSQYLTGLLLMLPLLKEEASIHLTTPLVSSGYIDITTQVMSSFGVDVLQKDGMWQLAEKHTYRSPVFRLLKRGRSRRRTQRHVLLEPRKDRQSDVPAVCLLRKKTPFRKPPPRLAA